MTAGRMPAAEIDIDAELVRTLVREQHPDLASLEVRPLAYGWDNAVYRLGDALAVRLPRRQVAVELLERELRWLPVLAPRLPLPVPAPVRIGAPSGRYPWPWCICRYVAGESAVDGSLADPNEAASVLGGFLRALHVVAPSEAPRNPLRGIPLSGREPYLRGALDQLSGDLDAGAVEERWQRALAAPVHDGPATWIHGDLHPANMVVDEGRISGVIDFGDFGAGDPATDLSVAWMLLPPDGRAVLRAAAGDVDDATWERARGWALALALAYLANSADAPHITRIGERTLEAVLADG